MLRGDAAHAAEILHALIEVDDDHDGPLRAGLVDELALVQARVVAALSLLHDRAVVGRAAAWLADPAAPDHQAALALETLEVSLEPGEKALALPVLHALADVRRALDQLARHVDVRRPARAEVLDDLLRDREGRWRRPWLGACAVEAARRRGWPELNRLLLIAVASDDEVIAETAGWLRPGP